MRGLWVLVPLMVLTGLTAGLGSFAVRQYQERPILVRVRGTHVRFRVSKPQTLADQNVVRYAEHRETFLASAKEYDSSQARDWYCLTNIASHEVGWVAGDYVETIEPTDAPRLERLGSSLLLADFWIRSLNIISVISALITICGFIVGLSRLQQRPSPETIRPIAALANVVSFRARPSAACSQIIFGASSGTPWFYRPKVREEGGGA